MNNSNFKISTFFIFYVQKKKKQSDANLYIVPFAHYTLHESMPLSMMKRMDEDVPPGEKQYRLSTIGSHTVC